VTLEEAAAWRAEAPGPVVFTNGVFDLLHPGHVELLERARGEGGSLLVALNTDRSVRTLNKGTERPIVPQDARARVIAALAAVDRVLLFDEPTPAEVIARLRPDVIVKGGDYQVADVVGGAETIARGGRVVIVPTVAGHSTTHLVEKLRAPSR
jgi:D-beta-D-heptose 7-phosphate kinase/D-beta-D-heptose 1-phosphate adenosyltransferase